MMRAMRVADVELIGEQPPHRAHPRLPNVDVIRDRLSAP
jgi:hypothetical protein